MTGAAKVAAIILAAGESKRFGPANKLLHPLNGQTMIEATVKNTLAARLDDVIVVTGHDAGSVVAALEHLPVRCIHNATPHAGMGASLAAGVNALSTDTGAAFIMLGDMPHVQSDTLTKMVDALKTDKGRDIAVPVFEGRRGHPVLFAARYFPQLGALNGDQGARQLLRENPEKVKAVGITDAGTVQDIDTPDDVKAAADV